MYMYFSHSIQDKQELWWLYAADRRLNRMVIPPERVAGLQTEKEVF